MTVNVPVRELVENVSQPFERARAMPRSVYTSEAFLKAELENVFARDWVSLGRASALKNPGDYLAYELAGQPIVVLRDAKGELKAYSNVCRHRMSTLLEGRGSTRAIVCPYHGWTYNLDGSLRAAPAMSKNAAFCKEDVRLPSVRCEEWLGWIMVTLNPAAPPVAEQLSEVHALIEDFGMENYVESFRETFRWNTNWKVLAENFMESYHLPVCHADTIGGLSKLEEMVCPPGKRMFNYHWILKDDTLKLGLAHPSNTRLKGERRRTTFLLSVYPSLLITITPGYFWYLSVHPHGPGQVDVIYGGGLSPDFAYAPDAQESFAAVKKLLDHVNEEDKGCVERVYQGLSSDLSEPGPLSHLERPNYDFAQYLADRTGGFERSFG